MKLVNIGFGNMVSCERIVSIVSPESAPIKRLVQEAKESGNVIDATQGRKTKSVIITDSELIVLSYLTCEVVGQRIDPDFEICKDDEDE